MFVLPKFTLHGADPGRGALLHHLHPLGLRAGTRHNEGCSDGRPGHAPSPGELARGPSVRRLPARGRATPSFTAACRWCPPSSSRYWPAASSGRGLQRWPERGLPTMLTSLCFYIVSTLALVTNTFLLSWKKKKSLLSCIGLSCIGWTVSSYTCFIPINVEILW